MSFTIFDRDPALWLGLLKASLYAVSVFVVPLSENQSVAIIAVGGLALSLMEAWAVARDRLVPVILGLAQALITLALAFGADLTEQQTGTIMVLVTAAVSFYTRTQVTAPIDAEGNRVAKAPLLGLAA